MTASRTQHFLASSAILAVALFVGWFSFTQEPADAFLFPRMISIFFMLLAIWNFARAALGVSKVGEGLDLRTALAISSGLIVTLIYIFWGAKGLGRLGPLEDHWLIGALASIKGVPPSDFQGQWITQLISKGAGFYTSSSVAFFVIYTLYDPASFVNPVAWVKRAFITLIFMLIIYGLFAELLQVQTPRGVFDNAIIPVFATLIAPLKSVIGFLLGALTG